MNPYLIKLGVESTDPTHFELLHIRHDEIDKDVIKAAAKKALHRLGSDPDDDSYNDWKRVQRQIKQAYHCLIDEQQRMVYRASLLEQQSSADVSELDDFSLTVHDDGEQDTESGLDTVTDELRAEMQSMDSSRQSPPTPPPVVLPMAEVVTELPEAARATSAPAAQSPLDVNVDATTPVTRQKRKGSPWLLILILAGLIVAAAAVGGFIWLQNQG